MNTDSILSKVDHTLLTQTASFIEIKQLIDEAVLYKTASVCIPPSYVKMGKEYAGNRIPICTVIGFPNGYNTTEVKIYETKNALDNGADEIDMVINLTSLKSKDYNTVEEEIKRIKKACGSKILKVIIETCLLTKSEKIMMCKIVTEAGVDFIKTSTGFSKSGANAEDIILFKEYLGDKVRIKAAGGIAAIKDAVNFIELGADRLGTSRMIQLINSNFSTLDY